MTNRYEEITEKYLEFIDQHVADVATGRVSEFLELNQIAVELAISHKHLIEVLKQTRGNHPCHFYDLAIIEKAKELLIQTDLPSTEIARKLTYDPSNFSKFFKKWIGETPGSFRKKISNQ